MKTTLRQWVGAFAILSFMAPGGARASLFNMPRFIPNGEYALGLEPVLTLTPSAGLAANLRYTLGLTDLNNLGVLVGTGGGPDRFRVGSNVTFDIFPDIEGQPGIGIAVQGLYVRHPNAGVLELTAIPYIHKVFVTGGNEVEPFLGVPFGIAFSGGTYQAISNIAVGSLFKNSDHLRYVMEVGVNINQSESYVSGGIVYYH